MSDFTITVIILICFFGSVWSGFMMERHRREVRVYKQVMAEGGWFPEWLQERLKKSPRWIVRLYESTFRHDD